MRWEAAQAAVPRPDPGIGVGMQLGSKRARAVGVSFQTLVKFQDLVQSIPSCFITSSAETARMVNQCQNEICTDHTAPSLME